MQAEDMKRIELPEFLSRHYGMDFSKVSGHYYALSPFGDECNPSFIVRHVDGHWLFKDFSSGYGGSIIDFVQIKEKLSTPSTAMSFISKLIDGSHKVSSLPPSVTQQPSYDLGTIYQTLSRNGCRESKVYLRERGISKELISVLDQRSLVLDNHIHNRKYCCFVVRDHGGNLCCLDNHEIGGSDKFVLGRKYIFTLDYEDLQSTSRAFVTEGIIDYLSIKVLGDEPFPGLALMGNTVQIPGIEILDRLDQITAAFDDDQGGYSAGFDLHERFASKSIDHYDLEKCKDPNELLQVTCKQQRTNLTPERKLQIYQEFLRSDNKSELARRWGIDRSYLYEIARDCETILNETFQRRLRGRPSSSQPRTLEEALDRIEELEKAHHYEKKEKERFYARQEFLKLRLKWASDEVSDDESEPSTPPPKKHRKKKKKRKR